jgi:hypothetical protein
VSRGFPGQVPCIAVIRLRGLIKVLYRFYPLDGAGRISGPPQDLECQSDADAHTIATSMRGGQDGVEVWVGTRKVVRLGPVHELKPVPGNLFANAEGAIGRQYSGRPGVVRKLLSWRVTASSGWQDEAAPGQIPPA